MKRRLGLLLVRAPTIKRGDFHSLVAATFSKWWHLCLVRDTDTSLCVEPSLKDPAMNNPLLPTAPTLVVAVMLGTTSSRLPNAEPS